MQQQTQPQLTYEAGRIVMSYPQTSDLPTVKDATVNDRDRTQDLLAQEKYLTAAYTTALAEMGHEELTQVVKQNFETCHKLQRQLFNLMFHKGWYKLPVANAEAVKQTVNQFKQYQTQFPFPTNVQGTSQTTSQTQ